MHSRNEFVSFTNQPLFPLPFIAEVILPLAVKSNFSYTLNEQQAQNLIPGMRVLVNFGKSKIYTGVIRRVLSVETENVPKDLKPIEEVLDQEAMLQAHQLKLFEWMAFYYMCTEGEILKAALPAGLKPESALRVSMVDGLDWEALELSDKEYLLLEALSIQPTLTFKEVSQIWNIINPTPRLNAMAGRGIIHLFQQVEEKYKPKFKRFLQLAESYTQEDKLREAFDSLSRAPHQENLLMRVVEAFYKDQLLPKSETLKELELGAHVVKSLVKKGFITEVKVQVDRVELYGYKEQKKEISFTDEQAAALKAIRTHFSQLPLKPVLLHGVTGSGKTHLYIEIIKDILAQGKQALYLLPEITLTKQIIDRVKSELGDKVGVYHSKFNDQERVEIWQKVLKREYKVVIGVRSAVFLPFPELGLIVVDEEHDYSFKQHEPAPRYHARDLSIYYAQLLGCPILLGSATPAFETYYNAQSGKFHLVEMHKRAVQSTLPVIEHVDMRVQRKKRLVQGIFSSRLKEAITEALEKKEQVILFQNRRGYAPFLVCETCGQVPQCINCDISLTYHKEKQQLRCHYCGYTHFNINACEHCANFTLKRAGIGTEKIEEEVMEAFPDAQVRRMDLDTTRGKMAYHTLITQFENKQIDILVGTQMVSKGLDFENVTLVGVIHADTMLSFPDFRTYERAYQLLTQVSGRAGRRQKQGHVIIQTLMPDNVVLHSIEAPYPQFFHKEMPTRKQLGYPPFSRLIRIEIKHKNRDFIERESLRLHKLFKPYFGANLLGPEYALVARVRNQYRMQFLIKLPKALSIPKIREAITTRLRQYYEEAPQKTLRINIDVDPI